MESYTVYLHMHVTSQVTVQAKDEEHAEEIVSENLGKISNRVFREIESNRDESAWEVIRSRKAAS